MREEAAVITLQLARRFEGLFLSPYLCPAGVPTIGYGATYYQDGIPVTMQDAPITKSQAESLLLWQISVIYLPATIKLCPHIDTPERLGALTDFCFNVGATALKSSTLRRKINAGQWDEVPEQLGRWVYAGGRRLRGLARRRKAEADLI